MSTCMQAARSALPQIPVSCDRKLFYHWMQVFVLQRWFSCSSAICYVCSVQYTVVFSKKAVFHAKLPTQVVFFYLPWEMLQKSKNSAYGSVRGRNTLVLNLDARWRDLGELLCQSVPTLFFTLLSHRAHSWKINFTLISMFNFCSASWDTLYRCLKFVHFPHSFLLQLKIYFSRHGQLLPKQAMIRGAPVPPGIF